MDIVRSCTFAVITAAGSVLALSAASAGMPVIPIAAVRQEGNEVFLMHGACGQLLVGPRDLTKMCKGKLVSFTLANGRVGFIFTLDGAELQFSGQGMRQAKLPSGLVSQPIDRVRFTMDENGPDQATNAAATGSCSYGDPFAGTTRITCVVMAGQGRWRAQFVTDGESPETMPQ